MKVAITGAGGFVGSQLAQSLFNNKLVSKLTLMDARFHTTLPVDGSLDTSKKVTYVEGNLGSEDIQQETLGEGLDILYHLAAVPGGAAQKNPSLSRKINLDATLSLFEKLAASKTNKPTRVVYASTIAVFGDTMPERVDDNTPVRPEMVYGCHKAMVELALANMHRHGSIDAVALRLSGIVARPPAPSGLKSAFMSEVFHALSAGKPFTSPLEKEGAFWLSSLAQCIKNLVHAGLTSNIVMPDSRVVTLPAVYCSMSELVNEILVQTGQGLDLVSYVPQADVAGFGNYPPLSTKAAEFAGFSSDGALASLVSHVLSSITRP